MEKAQKLIPIYTTKGDLGGFLSFPYIYNKLGEWIGWVTSHKEVYSVHGHFVGKLTKDPRIIGKRELSSELEFKAPPQPPPPIRPPAMVPLAPQMAEIPQNFIDILGEAEDRLPGVDAGEFRKDLD